MLAGQDGQMADLFVRREEPIYWDQLVKAQGAQLVVLVTIGDT